MAVATKADAQTTIWAGQLAAAQLPPICVKSGRPAERWVRVSFVTYPAWTWLLLLAGALPFVIVRFVVQKSARGRLPYAEPQGGRLAALRWVLPVLLIVTIVLFIAAIPVMTSDGTAGAVTLGLAALLLAALIVLNVYVRVALLPRGRVLGDPRIPDRWVVLHGVHPAFADAVRRGPGG
jgi:hypothetical protein